MAEFIYTVGPGQTYATIQAAWNALPATVPVGDTYKIQLAAKKYEENLIAESKTVDGSVIIEPIAGAAWHDVVDYQTAALSDTVPGCAQFVWGVFNGGVFYIKTHNVTVRDLRIEGISNYGAIQVSNINFALDRCLLVASGTAKSVLRLAANNATVTNCILIKRSSDTVEPCLSGLDSNDKTFNFYNNIVFSPTTRAHAWVGAWNYGSNFYCKNNAIFGFSVVPGAGRFHASSGYNATDLASHPGTNNLLSLSAANQYVAASDPIDLRLKAGSVLLDAGTDTGVTVDFSGAARTLPYSIGPQEALFSEGGGDTTAPTLTSPTASATGATTASGSVSTNEGNGTLYYLASANATEAAATVKAGSSQAVSAVGTQNVTVSGLTASTAYYLHFLHRDAAGNDSAVSTSAQFTTSAAGDTTAPTLTGAVTFASITQTSYTAQWSAGSDNVTVTGYEYQIGGTAGAWADAGNNLSAAITGRTAGATEMVYVRAYDAAGNRSTPAISGSVTLLAAVAGVTVTEPLKNNTGTVLASQSGVRVAVLQAADLVSVYETSGLTTNASGILGTISNAAITAGQQYHVAIKLADGGVGITGPITAS